MLSPSTAIPATLAASPSSVKQFYRKTALDHFLWRSDPSKAPRLSERKRLVEELYREASFTRAREAAPLPSYEAGELDYEGFLAATDHYRRAIVIRGFARENAAVRTWNEDFLKEKLAGAMCTVSEIDDKDLTRGRAPGTPKQKMDFAEYFERMHEENLYLREDANFTQACPSLVDDLELEKLKQAFTDPRSSWDEMVVTNLFLGNDRGFSAVHSAPGGNFFLQVVGRKTWIMTEPRYTPYMFPMLSRPFQVCTSYFGSYKANRDHPERSELYRVPRYEVTLEPGDLLYNAPWWWHEVWNLDRLTIGCAVRHVPTPSLFRRSPSWANNRSLTLISIYPFLRAISYLHYGKHLLLGGRHTRPLRNLMNSLWSDVKPAKAEGGGCSQKGSFFKSFFCKGC